MPQPLSAFVRLSKEDAFAQWVEVRRRQWAAPGKRQVAFLPVETLLCLCASLVVDHRKFGSVTAHLAPEPVPSLAALFKRPNSSILAKMANLDGSRAHGGKNELEAGVTLLSDPSRLTEAYILLLTTARQAGVGATDLADFLGLESGGEFNFRGQDELDGVDLVEALSQDRARWQQERSDLEDLLTTKIVEVSARVGQHRFASQVLAAHGHCCVFCGLSVETDGRPALKMLVASHIKPWREGTPRERLDPRNGLTACPTHDVAFDTGLIGVDADLNISVRPDLQVRAEKDVAVRAAFGDLVVRHQLVLPTSAVRPKVEYLRWHGEYVYQGHVA